MMNETRVHERRALHALDIRSEALDRRGDRTLVAVNGVDADPGHGRQAAERGIHRWPRVDELPAREWRLVLAEQLQLLDAQKRFAVFGAEVGNAIGHDVDNSARRQGAIEAATDADVERQIV